MSSFISPRPGKRARTNSLDLEHRTSADCPRRHERYYWHDGTAIFLVDNVLFNVHRYLFEQSDVFQAMFSLPPPIGEVIEGMSDDRPIRLDGIRAVAFEHLLWYMYPAFHTHQEILPVQGWVSILDLATMFDFHKMREDALCVLQRSPEPVLRLQLACKYQIDEWLPRCYIELCLRPAFLSPPELALIDRDTGHRLLRARELVRSHLFRRAHGLGTPWPCPAKATQRKHACNDAVASMLCDVLLKGNPGTQPLVATMFAKLRPSVDSKQRGKVLCTSCALAWERTIWAWLGLNEIRGIVDGVFGLSKNESRRGSQSCGSTTPAMIRPGAGDFGLDNMSSLSTQSA